MDFGPLPVAQAEGSYLAHTVTLPGGRFKKGRRLTAADIEALAAAGLSEVIAARLGPGDAHEDEAAARIADALAGSGLTATAAFTGRCNLIAAERGLLCLDRSRIDRLNGLDEALTIATLGAFELAEPRQMAATVKIIPFALTRHVLDRALKIAAGGAPIAIAPLRAKRIGLVQTTLPGLKESVLDKTREVTDRRLAALDCPPVAEVRCPHLAESVSAAIETLNDSDVILISGASAIVDRRDVVPTAIEQAGGRVRHFGMPVDPGNLILLAERKGRPLVGLPGCARSPKLNGFDWVLERLVAGVPVGPADLQAMGVGGLLKDTAQRPLPRSAAVEPPPGNRRAPRVAALLLAAGQAKRMGSNKLIQEVAGKPLVRYAAEAALASQAAPVILVTGHRRDAVEEALEGLDLLTVHNRNYTAGLSTSLKRGLAALPEGIDAAVVLLGDMPRIAPEVIDRLIASFNPLEGRAICLPVHRGRRGNPVLLGRQFFAEAQTVEGDLGARDLLREYADQVAEVPVDAAAVLLDIDTPEALARLRERAARSL
ncbi:MAG: NTP transferase domain-containing protein [Rhodospirillales bacterium]|nr:NTP transferase domain-containing protein [Rhodospirillales bacterium]